MLGPAARAGAAWRRSCRPCHWAAPPVMLQPLSATGRFMKIGLSSKKLLGHRTVHDRLLDHPAAVAAVPGVANVAIWGERIEMLQVQVEPAQAARERRHRSKRSWRRRPTPWKRACCSYSDGALIGTGGFIDTPNQRFGDPSRPAHRRSPEDLGEVAIDEPRTARPLLLSDVAKMVRGPPAAGRRRGDQRRPGPDADRREVPLGQHAGGDQAGSRAALAELRARAAGIEIDPTIFRPATFIELSIENLTRGAAARLPAGRAGARAVPLRVADRADQLSWRSRCR